MAKSFPDLNKDGKTSFADVLVGRGVETSKTATAKKGGSVKKYASGGMTSSASRRADGIATKGKTRGKMC